MEDTTPNQESKYSVVIPQGLEWCAIDLITSNSTTTDIIDTNNIKIFPPSPQSQDELKSLLQNKEYGIIKQVNRKRKNDNDKNDSPPVKNNNNEIFIGYYYKNNTKIYSSVKAGLMQGLSLLQFNLTNNSPQSIQSISKIRGLGPMVALVDHQYNESFSSLTLDEAESYLLHWIHTREYKMHFTNAFNAWMNHVQSVWIPIIKESLERKTLSSYGIDTTFANNFMQTFQEKERGTIPFTYRVSCVRSYSNAYSYKREELLKRIAGVLIPCDDDDETICNKYPIPKVNLKNYDFEIVLFILNQTYPMVGITLSPFRLYNCKDFSNNKVPADVTPPYVTGKSNGDAGPRDLVTMRPSTARLLVQCAEPRSGDIILDPCAGIGTLELYHFAIFC